MAIIVNEVKDYANNGVPTMSKSTLKINSPMYSGGLPKGLSGLPFTLDSGIPVSAYIFIYIFSFKPYNNVMNKLTFLYYKQRIVYFILDWTNTLQRLYT